MNTVADNLDVTDALETAVSEETANDTRSGLLPFGFSQAKQVVLESSEDGLTLSYVGQLDTETLLEVRRTTGANFALEQVDEATFQARLSGAYQRNQNQAAQMAEDLSSDVDLAQLVDEIPDLGDLMDAEDDAPIIRLINAILSQAVKEQASDIHIETFEDRLSVRYRIDGVLAEVLSPKRMLAPLLVSRLKVMAKLDIAEKRIPQDGRISVRIAGHAIDIRMSTIPSAHGERVVLRLLDKQAGQLDLVQLKMNAQVGDGYRAALARPHGIILVTGPTGSGKTTTLYAGLSSINQSSRNILTIEDPVEYMLPGIGQTQVNPKVDMTFARGLRAILRQDPDVVMVGEMRDAETAQIAIQAALTGHLVFSTVHTNSAPATITRLIDMGVEPFLVSSTIIGVLAQRLVRQICSSCKEPYEPHPEQLRELGLGTSQVNATFYRGRGCPACRETGYRGRLGLHELLIMGDSIKDVILKSSDANEIKRAALRHGLITLRMDGIQKIRAGLTTLEEVLSITVEDQAIENLLPESPSIPA